jgi:hypothetical protein
VLVLCALLVACNYAAADECRTTYKGLAGHAHYSLKVAGHKGQKCWFAEGEIRKHIVTQVLEGEPRKHTSRAPTKARGAVAAATAFVSTPVFARSAGVVTAAGPTPAAAAAPARVPSTSAGAALTADVLLQYISTHQHVFEYRASLE